jgi:FkbM family methyltransferase
MTGDASRTALPAYLTGDRSTLETVSRQQAQAVRLNDGAVLCRVLGKYLMFADADDLTVTPHMSLNGYWESWTTLAIARALAPGANCVDVGANHGYFTLIMADAAGPTGRVLGIEPNPRLATLLEYTLEVNGFDRLARVLSTAASDQERGTARLVIPGRRWALASLYRHATAGDHVVDVETTTIDRLTDEWPSVDFVKIDAEGSEEAIWRGMRRTLDRNLDITVVMELKPSGCADAAAFIAALRAEGFPLRYIDYDAEIRDLSDDQIFTERSGGDWMLFLRRAQ